ncbi:MAG: HEAT repeat domain-containing protein [Planctomycetota bacterium]|jgi:HEAT repeat protein
MKHSTMATWGLMAVLSVVPAGGWPAEPAPTAQAEREQAKPTETRADAEPLSWLSSLGEGHRRALADREPMLIRAGARWCPICRRTAEEIEEGDVQKELRRWTRVYVDVDLTPGDASELGVTAVPAWRIRTPSGQSVAARDGYVAPEDLLAWLAEHYEGAKGEPAEVLLESEKPDALALVQLVRQLGERDPAIRETAIRRLLPHPQVARPAVVKAFREGKLGTRLAALELLREWRAPVDDVDPWRPETITDQATARLDRWCDEEIRKPSRPEELSDEELAGARRQIERMLRGTESDAAAIRERLARLGPALLAEVYARLKQADTDDDRQRLLALRYRMVADDALVLRWPSGMTRLAATDSAERQRAADELARMAAASDQALLLELFSDPDPLVREISLRGLQHIGGRDATAALVKLLDDPEPNVRAAVLKQLEETPQASMVPKVAAYLKKEGDPDLLVHAIRFLRAVGGPEAIRSLMGVLEHESWQVRAEAAAGLGDIDVSLGSGGVSFSSGITISDSSDDEDEEELQADVYVALLKLLDDADAFVVSRAVEGLGNVDMIIAVEPLVQAAVKHPNLASQIVGILAAGDEMRPKALPRLRELFKHDDPVIRAAAVGGLRRAAPDAAHEEITAGLGDAESMVRIASASALFSLLEQSRRQAASRINNPSSRNRRLLAPPLTIDSHDVELVEVIEEEESGNVFRRIIRMFKGPPESPSGEHEEPPIPDESDEEAYEESEETPEEPASEGSTQDESPDEDDASAKGGAWDKWLEAFCAGEGRPEWMEQTIGPLQKMLEAEAAEERMAAAQTMVPLGKVDEAIAVLIETADSSPAVFSRATQVLPWLTWDRRLSTFDQLRKIADQEGEFSQLVNLMTEVADRRLADSFWELLEDEETAVGLVGGLYTGLLKTYLGERYYDLDDVTPSARRRLIEEAEPRAANGSEAERLVALALLAGAARDAAAETAAKLADDPNLSDQLRRDAFQIRLLVLSGKEAVEAAVAAMGSRETSRRKLALVRLIDGASPLRKLRDELLLTVELDGDSVVRRSGEPIVPAPPAGLEADDVRPLLDDPDPTVAAYAGYSLALFGEKRGLEPLLRQWRSQDKEDRQTSRLVYRAIAALDDPAYLDVLEDIYARLNEHEMGDFYWTVRIMSGPEILRFRKRIRDEVGMDGLR